MSIASDAGSQAVAKLDANKDGVLDYDELAKAPGLRAAVPTIKKMGNFRGPPPSESQLKSAKISCRGNRRPDPGVEGPRRRTYQRALPRFPGKQGRQEGAAGRRRRQISCRRVFSVQA